MRQAFERDGFSHFPGALGEPVLARLETAVGLPLGAGVRLSSGVLALVADLLGDSGSIGTIAKLLIGRPAFPVRAILFDKTKQPIGRWVGTKIGRSASLSDGMLMVLVHGPPSKVYFMSNRHSRSSIEW